MRKYLSVFRIKFISGLQYRAAALAGLATQFAWGMMNILLFRAFYTAAPESFPMPFSQLASYLWLQQALLALFMVWFWEMDIFNAISDGHIAYELARPMNLYNRWFTQTAASRLAKALLRCAPILVIAALLPGDFRLSPPASPAAFLQFSLSAVLALGVVVAFGMLICISAFFTLNSQGMRAIAAIFADFMAGSYIPLPFFPTPFRQIAELLPFASMQNMPLRIYSGNISGAAALWGMALQLFWLAALVVLGRLLMRKTQRHVVVQGG